MTEGFVTPIKAPASLSSLEHNMDNDPRRVQKDAVTIGKIRRRYNRVLDDQIDTLNKLIRQGYFKRPEAEKYLKETIGETLTKLQNIDAMASAELIAPEAQDGQ